MRIPSLLIAAVLLVWPTWASGQPKDNAAYASVVAIAVATGTDFQGVASGVGFVVRADGVVLTAAHVVKQAVNDAAHTHILALWSPSPSDKREYFSASVVCATPPSKAAEVADRQAKDVAVLRLAPVPSTDWPEGWGFAGAPGSVWTAHRQALPKFAPLPLAERGPQPGMAVRMPGYVASVPRSSVSSGTVGRLRVAKDGTTLFEVRTQGHRASSGSPVLGPNDQVVGMWSWDNLTDDTLGMAEGVDALHRPCGKGWEMHRPERSSGGGP